MEFKIIYSVDLFISRGTSAVLTYGGPHEIVVRIESYTDKGIEKDPTLATRAKCTISSRQKPSEKIRAMFDSVAARRLPSESSIPQPRPEYIREDNSVAEPHPIPFDILPLPMKSFVDQVGRELDDYGIRTVRVLRWRGGQEGRHNPIRSRDELYWSFEGKECRLRSDLRIVLGSIVGSLDMKTVEDDVIALVSSGSSEPLSHELLREAFDQAPTNPRSALLVGIAAAEVGFKGLVLELAPQTEWLVETVPSPPLVMMLREYMPRLPVKLKIDEKVPKIPDNVLGTLQNGVQARNKTTHATRSKPLDLDTLKELLLTVRDLLWIFDYYSGLPWALDYVRPHIRAALASS